MTTDQKEHAQRNIERLGLQELFARADMKGELFCWAGDWDVLFTPDELRLELANDRFRHGPVNWKLVSAKSILALYHRRIEELREERAAFAKKVGLE